ncbi:cutinase family protein [Nocardia bovistercoris]|uniref:Cutinase family protein n=1 Tax=Nocardia bovistercoris TaxID=2785916 RepID=A0A931IFE4_9NOCA|nr:cutinase family protein [Nocardia bovistercoris]MBH0779446.1 cutinase family protein [Nocardia bovistercoris]
MFTRRKIGTVACAAAMAAAVAHFDGAAVANAAPQCPGTYVVAVPGTWETSNSEPEQGMLAMITDNLRGDVRTDYVHYAATAFPWEGEVYGRSKAEATDRTRGLVAAMARECAGTRIVLLGYSQGADAAGDVAAEIGTGLGPAAPAQVALVGLISDPKRSPTDNLVGPAVVGAGAGGPRIGAFGWVSPQTYTFCAVGDLYCSMPSGDFAGRIAGLAAQLSNPDPTKIGDYQQQAGALLGDVLAAGGIGLLSDQLNNTAYEQRRRQIDDFVKSGIHQSYPNYAVGGGATPITWLRQRLVDVTR